MQETIQAIQTLGVPIVVMLWFMFKTDKVLRDLTKIVAENTTATKVLTTLIRDNHNQK